MYPTPKEILASKPKFRDGTILITKLWKARALKNWSKDENWVKMEEIGLLIEALCVLYKKKSPKIMLDTEYSYEIGRGVIHLDYRNPSIISSLHELAHYFYGKSELKACRWSVWLFKECFPGLYKNLKWNKHLLVKK